jgi:hypothetical protein
MRKGSVQSAKTLGSTGPAEQLITEERKRRISCVEL